MHDGKALRVFGFFLVLLGSGVILDSNGDAAGAAIAVCGIALFVWGIGRLTARSRTDMSQPTTEGSGRC
jgi:hypothetical protein